MMERAVVVCERRVIDVEHLPADRVAPVSKLSEPPSVTAERQTYPGGIEDALVDLYGIDPGRERARILTALAECRGNQTQAAKMLGVSRRTLVTKLGQLALPRPRKKPRP